MKSRILKTFFSIVFLSIQWLAFSQSPIEKIEPPYWWSGMESDQVELLVYGPNITEWTPSLSDEHVNLVGVKKTKNANYLFLTLEIDPSSPKKDISLNFKRKRKKVAQKYSIVPKSEMKEGQAGLNSTDFIYLVFPDRFANSAPENDSNALMQDRVIARDSLFYRHGGDLQGVSDHLDYIEELGVTALWLNPVWENDQPKESYHGYAPTDLYRVDRRFGSNEAYETLVDQCHARGIKVIKDIVYNHWGDQHWIYQDLPDSSWVNFWPEFTRTTYKAPTLMDPYASEEDKRKMTDGWFDHHMPDLNQRNDELANYLIQHSIWWIGHFGVDAFRIDTYAYPDQAFMAKLGERILEEYPTFFMFGETWVHGTPIQAWFTDKNGAKKPFESHLQSVTDFQLHYALNSALNENFGWTEGASRLYYTLAKDILYEDASRNVTFLDNHDLSRIYSVVGEDVEKLKSAFAFMMTTRGIPSLYYGTEIGLKNFSNPDGLVRQDFPGGWPTDSLNKFTPEGRNMDENELFDFFSHLGTYRKNNPSIFSGSLTQYVPKEGVYMYKRTGEDKTILVVMNLNGTEKALDKQFSFFEKEGSFKVVATEDIGVDLKGEVILAPYQTIIIERNH